MVEEKKGPEEGTLPPTSKDEEGKGTAGEGTEGDSTGGKEDAQAKLEAGEDLTPEEEALLSEISGEDGDAEEGADDSDSKLTDEEKALLEKANPKVQKRFDSQTAKIKDLEAQIKALAEKSGSDEKSGGKTISQYTEDELYALKQERPEYAIYVDKELISREVDKRMGQKNSETGLAKMVADAERTAISKYPDLANPESEIYKLAATIYASKGYGKIADGSLVAAEQAASILRKKGKMFKQTESQRLSDVKKLGMTGASKTSIGVGGTSSKKLDDLEEKAANTRPGSTEWMAVMRERRRINALKSKAQ